MQQLNKSKKLVLAAIVGLTMLAIMALSSSVGLARLGAVFGSNHNVRNVKDRDDDDDYPPSIRDLTIPDSWAGQWQVTTTFRDALTGNLVAVDEGTDPICSGEEVGLSAFVTDPWPPEDDDDDGGGDPSQDGLSANCTGQALNDRLEVNCSSRFTFGDCSIGFRFAVRADRNMDRFNGQGDWRVVETSGQCPALLGQGETFQLSGTRLSSEPNGCDAAPSTLIEKFVQHPELVIAMPATIADLSALGKNGKVDLSWTAPTGASAYRILRAFENSPYELIALRRAKKGAAFRDHDVTNGVSYRYVIRWLDRNGRQSSSSNEVTVTPGPE